MSQNDNSNNDHAWDEELRQWLIRHIAENPHRPPAVLSRAEFIGMSRKALDAYIAGTYFKPKESGGQGADPQDSKMENAIRAYRERVEGTLRHRQTNEFTLTRTWERLRDACSIAINENSIVLVYGRPGIGKTRCLEEFALREMNSAPVSILCSRSITPLYFAQRLADELKLSRNLRIAEIEDKVAYKLRRPPRALIVDQANYLSEKSLGSLCYIWEKTRVPIIMSGTKELFDLFATSKFTEGVREQLSSRVAWHYLLPELSLAETKAIVERVLGPDATDEEVAQIFNLTGGVYRKINMLLPRVMDLAERNKKKLETGEVTMKEIINVAASQLILG